MDEFQNLMRYLCDWCKRDAVDEIRCRHMRHLVDGECEKREKEKERKKERKKDKECCVF